MLDYGFYNMDCMEGMKQFPDKYFDLAIVDPPYGGGFTEGGGCKGWFTKYNQRAASESGGDAGIASDNVSTGTRLRFHGGSKNPNDPWNKYLRTEDNGKKI